MANQPPSSYVVVRLVPDSPIDGTTFATYLDNLALQVQDAYTNDIISDVAYASPLAVFGWPPGSTNYLSVASAEVAESTAYVSSGDYGKTLSFESTDGISVGSYIYSADQTTIPLSGNTVVKVSPGSVTLSGTLPNFVSAGTVVSFIGQPPGDGTVVTTPGPSFTLTPSSPVTGPDGPLVVLHFTTTAGVMAGMGVSGPSIPDGTIVTAVTPTTVTISQAISGSPASVTSATFTLEPPFVTFTCQPSASAPHSDLGTLNFPSGQTAGIAVGTILSPVTNLVAPGTTVTGATATTLDIQPALLEPLTGHETLTLNFMLSSGIAQHTETHQLVGWNFFGGTSISTPSFPAAVATAIIPLTEANLPDYLDIKISATRGTEVIPATSTYYNVKVIHGRPVPVACVAVPADPRDPIPACTWSSRPRPCPARFRWRYRRTARPRPLTIFCQAMHTALANDPITGVATVADLINSECQLHADRLRHRVELPERPSAAARSLESLYTNPPNSGGGGSVNGSQQQ